MQHLAIKSTFTLTSISKPGSSKAVPVRLCVAPDVVQRCPERPGCCHTVPAFARTTAQYCFLLLCNVPDADPFATAQGGTEQPQIWPTSVDSDLIKQGRVNLWGWGEAAGSSYSDGGASSRLHQLESIMQQKTSHGLSPERALLFLHLPQLLTVSKGSTYRTKYFTFLVVHWSAICSKHSETPQCQTATRCYESVLSSECFVMRLMSSNEVTEKKQVKYTLMLVSHPLILVTYQRSHERFQNVNRLCCILTIILDFFGKQYDNELWGNFSVL